MAKKVKVLFTDRRTSSENTIFWEKRDALSLKRILDIVKQHDPKLYRKFNFIECDFGNEKSDAHDLFRLYFQRRRQQTAELQKENELLQARLDRPCAGRKGEDLELVKSALSKSKDFDQFNKIILETAKHTVSKTTYHRYKRQFGIK